ncbi:unnamed protein product [Prunus armeniaca]|uniref:Uncharacterized protein n=1 Tax=Prunus armeniaca TaxID=36596 RepID=A0A6J5VZL1_PRUAR|nr:unnamed protein product [Prunus armeniaca]
MDSEAFGAETGSSRVLSLPLLITGALILVVCCKISVSWMVILVSPILFFHISMLRTSLTLIYLVARYAWLLTLLEGLIAPAPTKLQYGWLNLRPSIDPRTARLYARAIELLEMKIRFEDLGNQLKSTNHPALAFLLESHDKDLKCLDKALYKELELCGIPTSKNIRHRKDK